MRNRFSRETVRAYVPEHCAGHRSPPPREVPARGPKLDLNHANQHGYEECSSVTVGEVASSSAARTLEAPSE